VPLDTRLRRFHGLAQSTAVLVAELVAGGPADRAGVQAGDLLVALDDAPVAGVDDLHRLLTGERAGVPARLTLLRRALSVTIEVTPDEA